MNKVSNIINNKIFKIIAIIVVLFSLVLGLSKSISNSNKDLVIVNNRLDKKQFKIFKQKDDKSGYEVYNGSGFPEGQKLNTSLTVCVDTNNNTVDNIFTYENGKFSVTSNKTVFCTLYFDLMNPLAKVLASSNPYVREYRGEGYYHDEGDKDTTNPWFTRPIYYWYAKTGTIANAIRDGWNVVYAGHCWQIIRTTEQGGVKLLYNGEPDIGTDQQGNTTYDCSDNRNLYHMGGIESEYDIGGSKVYADSYTATTSGTTTTFTLVNNDNSTPVATSISASNASTVVGKYTCGNTSTTCTNANLRKIVRIKTGTTAIIYTSTGRDNIGVSFYNIPYNSPGYEGYMYNDHTALTYKDLALSTNFYKSDYLYLTGYFTSSTLFSDTAPTWNSTNARYNQLTGAKTADEIKGSDSDYSALVGNYTFNKTSSQASTIVYYVVAVSGTTMYVRASVYGGIPSNANTTSYTIGTSIVDNLDGTYTIGNTNTYDITTWTASTISPSTNNYYYMCADGVSTTCTYGNARLIYSNSASNMLVYFLYNTNNTYGTYKLGTTLVNNNNNTYTLGGTTSNVLAINLKKEFSNNINRFMCISGDTTCAKANIYYNVSGSNGYAYTYTPDSNYKLANKYSYNNGTYTLDMSDSNSINIWDDFYTSNDGTPTFSTTMLNKMGKAHYICLGSNDTPVTNTTSCANVGYIYYYGAPTAYFMKLSGGQYINTNIDNVLYQEDNNLLWKMLYAGDVNTTSSTIKTNIDKWYEANLLNNPLEGIIDNNEIYCVDRSASDFRSWDTNATTISNNSLAFFGLGYKTVSIDNINTNVYNLSCPRKTDAYSKNATSKGNGNLTYPIGLISYPEMYNITGNYSTYSVRKSSATYSLSSPYIFNYQSAGEWYIQSGGTISGGGLGAYGVRPSIALKSTAEFTRGDGSFTNPYVVES